MPRSAARPANVGASPATRAVTGPRAEAPISSMSASACSSSSCTTTTARSGSSRATASVASARSIADAVTVWPRPSRTVVVRASASRSSSAARTRRPAAMCFASLPTNRVRTRTGGPILGSDRGRAPRRGLDSRAPAPRRRHSTMTLHDAERAREERLLFEELARTRDPRTRERIVERYLPLARQLARRYQRPEEPLEDLLQVASVGLVKAIDRFDATRDVAFSSYAVPTILGEIKRHFRDRTWAVRVPRDLQELALRAERLVGEMTRDLHRS